MVSSIATMISKTCAPIFLGCLMLAGVTGCGKSSGRQETAPVSGVVTLEGKPVPQGSLLFIPVVPGPPGQANLRPDGTFDAGTYEMNDGLIPGEYTVAINGQMEVQVPATGTQLAEDADNVKSPEQLPAKFGDSNSSGLTASIKMGDKNKLTFDLKNSK